MSANNGHLPSALTDQLANTEILIACPHCDEPVSVVPGTRMLCPHCDGKIEKRHSRPDPNTITQDQLPHTLISKWGHLLGKIVSCQHPDNPKQLLSGIVVGFDPQPRKDPYMPPMPFGEYVAVKCPSLSGKKFDFDIKHWPIASLINPPQPKAVA